MAPCIWKNVPSKYNKCIKLIPQYNRTGFAVFVIPVPLAALVLVVALTAKAVRRGCNHRSMRPNATCAALLATACACALVSTYTGTFCNSDSGRKLNKCLLTLAFIPTTVQHTQ